MVTSCFVKNIYFPLFLEGKATIPIFYFIPPPHRCVGQIRELTRTADSPPHRCCSHRKPSAAVVGCRPLGSPAIRLGN